MQNALHRRALLNAMQHEHQLNTLHSANASIAVEAEVDARMLSTQVVDNGRPETEL